MGMHWIDVWSYLYKIVEELIEFLFLDCGLANNFWLWCVVLNTYMLPIEIFFIGVKCFNQPLEKLLLWLYLKLQSTSGWIVHCKWLWCCISISCQCWELEFGCGDFENVTYHVYWTIIFCIGSISQFNQFFFLLQWN